VVLWGCHLRRLLSPVRPVRVLVRTPRVSGLPGDVHGTDTLGPSPVPFLYNVHPNIHITGQVGVLWLVINLELQWTSSHVEARIH
jgi:hypothetical protein